MENKLYRDTETGTVYNLEQMQGLHSTFLETCENPAAWTFQTWLMEVTGKNGTMEEYTRPTLKELLIECMENMGASELVDLHNSYCDAAGYPDNWIYRMNEFDEIMQGSSPWEVARGAYYSGKFCPANDYFWFNGYGNLESDDFPHGGEYDPIYLDDIADYIERERDSLCNDDIQDILDEWEEDEE